MLETAPHHVAEATAAGSLRLAVLETVCVFLVFFLHGTWPVPDVNEPHYVGKAKHYWDPAWCAGDTFLESRDAHHVFYWTCGWLTLVMPLPVVAWVGRVATWALLAYAWRRLSWQIVPRPLWAMMTAAVFVTLSARAHMAGEWVVGGFESKGIAYALVLLACEAMLVRRWHVAWPLLGAATAMHVLVGGWSLVAATVARLALRGERPLIRLEGVSIVLAAALGALGVVPAALLNYGADAEIVAEAARIYVFERLGHHLLLYKMRPEFITRFAVLVLVWLFVDRQIGDEKRFDPLRVFVATALFLAVAGGLASVYGLVAEDTRVAIVLRFYWFRLADVAIPLAVTLFGAAFIAKLWAARPIAASWVVLGALVAVVLHLGDVTAARLADPRPLADGARKIVDYPAWRSACDFIALDARIHPRARFLTPRMAHTFKWYSSQPEVANWKDVPQDAQSIVRWWQTLEDLHANTTDPEERWFESLAERDPATLLRLGQRYGASYLITESEPPLPLPMLRRTNAYAVYHLKSE